MHLLFEAAAAALRSYYLISEGAFMRPRARSRNVPRQCAGNKEAKSRANSTLVRHGNNQKLYCVVRRFSEKSRSFNFIWCALVSRKAHALLNERTGRSREELKFHKFSTFKIQSVRWWKNTQENYKTREVF